MNWEWDNNNIDFSQNCWFFDGYNGCQPKDGGAPKGPLMRDDEDLLDIITMIARRLF